MKLSVITINYNNAEGLAKTMDSVFRQRFSDFEYIVIDGGSTDGSKDLIVNNQDKIAYWCSEKDSGIYNAMNKGIREASGEYLLFLNSGDFLHDFAVLEDIHPFLSGEDIVYGDLLFVHGDGKEDLFVYPDVLSFEYFLERSLGHPAAFIKRALFGGCLYTETLKIVSDWEFFVKKIVLESCSYRHVERVISIFNMQGISSVSLSLCEEEKKYILQGIFPPMILDSLQLAACLKSSLCLNFSVR